MKNHVRAAMAASAISHANGVRVSSVYDYSGSGYLNIDASFKGNRLTGYDYTNSCHFDGALPSLYHYGVGSHVDLKPGSNGKYAGYDYGAGCFFDVTVRGKNAEIYDYGSSAFYSYST